jgi:hypothetical protein
MEKVLLENIIDYLEECLLAEVIRMLALEVIIILDIS